jgi:hypothetical protein
VGKRKSFSGSQRKAKTAKTFFGRGKVESWNFSHHSKAYFKVASRRPFISAYVALTLTMQTIAIALECDYCGRR